MATSKCVLILAGLLALGQTRGHAQFVSLDDCESAGRWTPAHPAVQCVVVATKPYEGRHCLKATWKQGHTSAATLHFDAGEPWGTHGPLRFWLRATGANRKGWTLRIVTETSDNRFALVQHISLDHHGWRQVRLDKSDFSSHYKGGGEPLIDWAKLSRFEFLLEGGPGAPPTIYFDDFQYEAPSAPDGDAAVDGPKPIIVNNCDTVDRWTTNGNAELHVSPSVKMEGQACLQVRFGQSEQDTVTTSLPDGQSPTSVHGLALWVRGPGVQTSARAQLVLETQGGGRLTTPIDIDGFEWQRPIFFPHDFAAEPGPGGAAPQWDQVRRVTVAIGTDAVGVEETLQLDDIRFEVTGPSRAATQSQHERFWWWHGPVDRFAAMHLRFAEYPRISDDGEDEFVSFSEYLLAPGMPYKIYLRSGLASCRVTIRDWDGNPIHTAEQHFPADDKGRYPRRVVFAMTAPQRCGTYVIDVEGRDKAGKVARTYQTGVFVLAKKLHEPWGYWGLHTFMGTKGDEAPHHRWIARTFDAFGVKVVRERVVFPRPGLDGDVYTQRAREFAEICREYDIRSVGVIYCINDKAYDFSKSEKPGPAPIIDPEAVVADARDLAASCKGLFDIWEVYNEPNRGPFDSYAEVLRLTYKGLKQGDPGCTVSMAGMGVWNHWQVKLHALENSTGQPYSDMLAGHLYPQPARLEHTLRDEMIAPLTQDGALKEKGLLMTEAGMAELDYQVESLLRAGLLPKDYDAQRMTQHWFARYGPVILGECMKYGAKLHGVNYFRSTPSMGDWILNRSGERVHAIGFFCNRWGTRNITLAQPRAYALHTQARMLTYDVESAKVKLTYDRDAGFVEHYAFRRPGETLIPMWIGVHAGMRAPSLDVAVDMLDRAAIAIAVDEDGNERLLPVLDGKTSITLVRDQVNYVRLLDGRLEDGVLIQHGERMSKNVAEHHLVTPAPGLSPHDSLFRRLEASGLSSARHPLRDRTNVYLGTPADAPRLIAGIADDRDLPVVAHNLPRKGEPMVLYSIDQRSVYIVGQTPDDLTRAVRVYRACLHSPKAGK